MRAEVLASSVDTAFGVEAVLAGKVYAVRGRVGEKGRVELLVRELPKLCFAGFHSLPPAASLSHHIHFQRGINRYAWACGVGKAQRTLSDPCS